ncbi:RAB6A-GEF complex partner protein 2, partial [Ceratocystis fimbriata CBS 114723]
MAPESRDSPNSIRVLVDWHNQTVFAGEEVKCTITFKNVSADSSSISPLYSPSIPTINHQRPPSRSPSLSLLGRARNVQSQPSRGKLNGASISQPPTPSRAHRSGLSLSVPPSAQHSRSGSVQWPAPTPTPPPPVISHDGRPNHSHRRSVSIVSIGSSASNMEDQADGGLGPSSPRHAGRKTRAHNRANSLQISPMSPYSASSANPSPRIQTSPAYSRNGHRSPQNPVSSSLRPSTTTSPGPLPDFRFPGSQQSPLQTVHNSSDSPKINSSVASPEPTENPPSTIVTTESRGATASVAADSQGGPAAKIISATSLADATPRSSIELYALSNNSSETLASEYPAQSFSRNTNGSLRPPHFRRQSILSPGKQTQPEVLMMGFAQLQGSFSLDGSLVNLSPFDQVKRKGVVAGQGGGVVGVETVKRDSGFFGWGSFKSSISELMGNNELSTIQEMRGAVKSKSIPLLSTPQSILFVDLQLAPGESKSFEYVFMLPRGLPPSHKGKAIKINYSLVVGTQRVGGHKEHQVRTIDVPFRILGSVNGRGEILGHDLMNPYIILQDLAKTKALTKSTSRTRTPKKQGPPVPHDTKEGFLAYVGDILQPASPTASGRSVLLSPTAMANSPRRPSMFEEPSSVKESIDLAILRSNMALDGQQSPNKFEIARNGQRVAVVMLSRPAYRLGETVTIAIDFSKSEIPSYAVHAALETTEKIDSSLAVRSEASIHRATRKTVASMSEATLYSRRFVFTPTIPISATPQFITSGVSLEWKVRLEFVVPATPPSRSNGAASGKNGGSNGGEEGGETGRIPHPLLEQISRDEKSGLVMVALENLVCESFEVAVPLRVYGTVGTGLEKLDREDVLDEG